jgi:hypothetical protein
MSSTFLRRRSKPRQKALDQLSGKVRRGGTLSDSIILKGLRLVRPFIITPNLDDQ